jgi:hypothetical protein
VPHRDDVPAPSFRTGRTGEPLPRRLRLPVGAAPERPSSRPSPLWLHRTLRRNQGRSRCSRARSQAPLPSLAASERPGTGSYPDRACAPGRFGFCLLVPLENGDAPPRFFNCSISPATAQSSGSVPELPESVPRGSVIPNVPGPGIAKTSMFGKQNKTCLYCFDDFTCPGRQSVTGR